MDSAQRFVDMIVNAIQKMIISESHDDPEVRPTTPEDQVLVIGNGHTEIRKAGD